MKKSLLLGVAVLGTILTGCAARNGYAAVRFGPPPAPRYGIVGYAPGPGFVWTEGYWDWRGGRWFWVDGRDFVAFPGRASAGSGGTLTT